MNMAYVAIFVCFAGAFSCFMAIIANRNNKKNNKNKE